MDTSVLILILIGIIIAAVVVIWRARSPAGSSSVNTRTRPPTFGDEPSTVELPRPVPRQPATPPAGSIPQPQPLPADDSEKEDKPPILDNIPVPQPARPGQQVEPPATPPPPQQQQGEQPPTFGSGFDDETMRGIPRDVLDRMR